MDRNKGDVGIRSILAMGAARRIEKTYENIEVGQYSITWSKTNDEDFFAPRLSL